MQISTDEIKADGARFYAGLPQFDDEELIEDDVDGIAIAVSIALVLSVLGVGMVIGIALTLKWLM